MADSPVRLVCFDLGGVVVRICRSLIEACEAAGIEPAQRRALAGVQPDAVAPLLHRHQTGSMHIAEYAAELCQLCGDGIRPDDVIAIHTAWLLGEYDGVAGVIDEIHERGLETAALSNTNAHHWELMHDASRYPALAKIRRRHASHLLGHAKPDQAAYRAFEERVGYRGGEILFFDDLAENVAAARALGWRTVQVDHQRCTAGQMREALMMHGLLPE